MSKMNVLIGALGLVGAAASLVKGALESKTQDQKIQQAVADALAKQSKEA